MTHPELSEQITDLCLQHAPVGSRVTCNPPPDGTDADYLLLVHADKADALRRIVADSFQVDGSDLSDVVLNTPEDQQFISYSDGEINLIVTTSERFYGRFMAATSVAKRLNLLDKADRVALFQAVLYGNPVEEPEPWEICAFGDPPAPYTVEHFTDKAGKHRWRVRALNGNLVATVGEGYENRAHRDRMTESLFPTFPRINVPREPAA